MKKLLIAMLAGLLLIGAAAAHNNPQPVVGKAKSCAIALAGGEAVIDKDLVAASTTALKVYSGAATSTWQIDDAKVDPVSASYSAGSAFGYIAGNINVDDNDRNKHCNVDDNKVANVEIWADAQSTAYNAARGSEYATGSTATFDDANVWADEGSLGSSSVAGSFSNGEACGIASDDAKIGDISNLVPQVPTA
jgi:hypothetical protein